MTYAGFDIDQFPGVQAMADIKKETNLSFVCFYLAPAPSHADTGWMPHRAELSAQGWGFLPTFLGQETTGSGSHLVDQNHGLIDGTLAAALMSTAGFPPGSYVYLDLENGPPLLPNQLAYVRAWVGAVHIHGYKAGVYVSHLLAEQVAKLVPDARIWAVKVSTVDPHPVTGSTFSTEDPSGSGYSAAYAWQHEQSANVHIGGHSLQIDLDVALTADPSK